MSDERRCECLDVGERNALMDRFYSAAERPFREHAPGECKCVNDLQLFQRGSELLWLCSVCYLYDDVRCPVVDGHDDVQVH